MTLRHLLKCQAYDVASLTKVSFHHYFYYITYVCFFYSYVTHLSVTSIALLLCIKRVNLLPFALHIEVWLYDFTSIVKRDSIMCAWRINCDSIKLTLCTEVCHIYFTSLNDVRFCYLYTLNTEVCLIYFTSLNDVHNVHTVFKIYSITFILFI